jgi:hypothetical protein
LALNLLQNKYAIASYFKNEMLSLQADIVPLKQYPMLLTTPGFQGIG